MRRFEAASGSALVLQPAGSVAGDGGDAVLVEAAAHQHVIGRVGARGGETPVVVGLVAEGPRVGVAVDGERAFLLGEDLSDLLHGENHLAARHGGADLEHAEVELVGDGDGDAILAGDHGQAFGELVVRSERSRASFSRIASAALTVVGARLAFDGFGAISSALAISSGLGFRLWFDLASGSSGAASAGASPFRGPGLLSLAGKPVPDGFHAFRGLSVAHHLLRPEIGREGIAIGLAAVMRRSTARRSGRRRRPWC